MTEVSGLTCPEPTRSQIDRLVGAIRAVVDDDLIGVYLHGSLAMGCFNPRRSDIDLLVVTTEGMSLEQKRRMVGSLLKISGDASPVEISFVRYGDLHPWRHPPPYDLHFSEAWRLRSLHDLESGAWRRWNDQVRRDPDLSAHVTVTRARGECLYGRPIAMVFPAVPAADYQDAILGDLDDALDQIEAAPVYGVLNACRVLCYLRTGRVVSKAEGGMWAVGVLPPEHRTLIRRALDRYRGGAGEDGFDRGGLGRFAGFVRAAISAAQSGANDAQR